MGNRIFVGRESLKLWHECLLAGNLGGSSPILIPSSRQRLCTIGHLQTATGIAAGRLGAKKSQPFVHVNPLAQL